jgi:DNA-binding Lrp family transcriptional regulator
MQKIELDGFDLRLLAALQADGRLTNQELADKVGLSASQCSRRRSRLEESGIIRGYHADLSAEALGLGVLVFVHVTLATHSPDNSKRFRDFVSRLDEVQEAYSLTGETDYLLKMVLPDLKSLAATVNEQLLAHDTVAHVRSSVVLDRLKETAQLPLKGTS